MTDTVGPTFWQERASMAGRSIGSYMAGWLVCKNLGVALIMAAGCAAVCRTWYCINDAATTASCCVNSSVTWFVPNCPQFDAAITAVGYQCWYAGFPIYYWTSSEYDSTQAWMMRPGGINGGGLFIVNKNCPGCTLAMRCVTY